jgi:beta-lactamase regulating signal transducer with metallopeptidase domain
LSRPDDFVLAAECAGALGLRRTVEVRIGDYPGGAAACGVWRPVVLLPREWNQWSNETKRAVLLHEMGHHASRDPLWRMVSLMAAAVYWFNPLVWWLAARLQSQAEFACDARVVGCGVRADRYAHILCDLASRAPATALGMSSPGGLEQRVRMLQRPRGTAAPLLLGAAAAVLATCALGLAVLRPGRTAATTAVEPPRPAATYSQEEIETRQSADPFPAD